MRLEKAFERRAARAEALAAQSEAAREPLLFAAGLYRAQGRLGAALSQERHSLCGRFADDAQCLLGRSASLLEFTARQGPPTLVEQATGRVREAPGRARERLLAFWQGEAGAREDYLSRALLRPYVEVLGELGISPDRARGPGRCPFCGGAPWIASRRAVAEAEAAERRLGCCLCGGEWPFARIRCPACLEEDPARLPTFQSDAHPAVRIEGCEACRAYLKSIDLTLDARAVPEVDDLMSLGMDLWAAREGFTRIEPGLAGI